MGELILQLILNYFEFECLFRQELFISKTNSHLQQFKMQYFHVSECKYVKLLSRIQATGKPFQAFSLSDWLQLLLPPGELLFWG